MGSVEAVLAERLLSLSLEETTRLLTGADFWSPHPEPAIGPRRRIEPAFWRGDTFWEYLDAQVMPEATVT
jgi:beta-glucosidase